MPPPLHTPPPTAEGALSPSDGRLGAQGQGTALLPGFSCGRASVSSTGKRPPMAQHSSVRQARGPHAYLSLRYCPARDSRAWGSSTRPPRAAALRTAHAEASRHPARPTGPARARTGASCKVMSRRRRGGRCPAATATTSGPPLLLQPSGRLQQQPRSDCRKFAGAAAVPVSRLRQLDAPCGSFAELSHSCARARQSWLTAEQSSELTGFPPRINRIFSTATLRRYFKGKGSEFRAEFLGSGFGLRI